MPHRAKGAHWRFAGSKSPSSAVSRNRLDRDLVLPQEASVGEVRFTQKSLMGSVKRQQRVPASEEFKIRIPLTSRPLNISPLHESQTLSRPLAPHPRPDSGMRSIAESPIPPAGMQPVGEEAAHGVPAVTVQIAMPMIPRPPHPAGPGALRIDLSHPETINVDEMTYEQLLELEEVMGKVSKGLSPEQRKVLGRVANSRYNRAFQRKFTRAVPASRRNKCIIIILI